ncbi:MAG TPA: AmmeMemoRadiSam system protein A [Vicinamibacterales bacterium]|nr:AmmeMemoRadiSam system protein A [Vicinamibacterales bacterium]
MTSNDDRRLLLSVAREAIAAHVGERRSTAPELTGVMTQRAGAFVTIHNRGELRGCIGHVEADEMLGRVIPRMAVAACSSDPRFPAVTDRELPELDLEISILGPLVPISSPDEIEVGRDGLVVQLGWHRGLLLPQVATEWKWDRETFLAHTCHKAGMPRDAWRNGAKVFRFEAEVFGERQPDRAEDF